MKTKYLSLFVIILFQTLNLIAQDTLIVYNNYKYKIGIKLTSEMSGDIALSPNRYQVYGSGVQFISRIKFSKFSLESGIYYVNKVYPNTLLLTANGHNAYLNAPFYYHNLSIPINLRYDTKILYLASGIYCDYLISTNSNYLQFESNILDMRKDRKLNVGINFIIGLEKNIAKYFNVFVQSQVSNNLTSTKLETPGRAWPYFQNIGYSIGANYKIQKNK